MMSIIKILFVDKKKVTTTNFNTWNFVLKAMLAFNLLRKCELYILATSVMSYQRLVVVLEAWRDYFVESGLKKGYSVQHLRLHDVAI
jgi:hypothetical protein